MNGNLAVGARFCVVFEKGNRSDGVRIADMIGVIAIGLEFPAVGTSMFFADAALPSGRDEAVAGGISAAVNECIGLFVVVVVVFGTLTLKLSFGV